MNKDVKKCILEVDACQIVLPVDEVAYHFYGFHFEVRWRYVLVERLEVEYWLEIARFFRDGENAAGKSFFCCLLDCFLG